MGVVLTRNAKFALNLKGREVSSVPSRAAAQTCKVQAHAQRLEEHLRGLLLEHDQLALEGREGG